ncbi:MAG: hypothetical protein HYZ28_13805 [Myxococcales bacterium]|nr:hypothetical protein [Myxococcales bacterium]
MPRLSFYCLVLTDGAAPNPTLPGSEFGVRPLAGIPCPCADDELFGPHAESFTRAAQAARAAYLFHGSRSARHEVGGFLGAAHEALAVAVDGVAAFCLDVLRLWPFPSKDAIDLPTDPLPEDVFALGFTERGPGSFRALTYGLSKLGQREITFDFTGRGLADEAKYLCSHLADYVMSQTRRVDHRQSMSFGFDRLEFRAAEGEAGGPLRGWHAPYVQRALPEELFPGVGLLEARCFEPLSDKLASDVTLALERSLEQRRLLDELGLEGEAPHQGTMVRSCACAGGPDGLVGWREEPDTIRHSGWSFLCGRSPHPAEEVGTVPLGALAHRLPQIVRYLALPAGCRVTWRGGEAVVDAGRLMDEEEEESGL